MPLIYPIFHNVPVALVKIIFYQFSQVDQSEFLIIDAHGWDVEIAEVNRFRRFSARISIASFAIWWKQRSADQSVETGRFRTGPNVKTKLSATYFLLGVHSLLLVIIAESGVDRLAFSALPYSFRRMERTQRSLFSWIRLIIQSLKTERVKRYAPSSSFVSQFILLTVVDSIKSINLLAAENGNRVIRYFYLNWRWIAQNAVQEMLDFLAFCKLNFHSSNFQVFAYSKLLYL